MENQAVWTLGPYLVSLALTLAVGAYAWRRREVAGASELAVFTWGESAWIILFILELVNNDQATKVFLDALQWIPSVMVTLAMFGFCLAYTERRFSNPMHVWSLLVGIGVFLLGLALTNDLHGLTQHNVFVESGEPFSALRYDFGPYSWLLTAYNYVIGIVAFTLLGLTWLRAPTLYCRQIAIMLLGILVPFIVTILNFAGLIPTSQSDVTPITFGVSNAIAAWGLFRYRLFDIVPTARNLTVSNLPDALLVLDNEDRLVDINPAGELMLLGEASLLIGKRLHDVVEAKWLPVVEQYEALEEIQFEASGIVRGEPSHLDIHMIPVRDHQKRNSGRLLIIRDITKRKLAEITLQEHTVQLETANEMLAHLTSVKDQFVSNVSHELRTPLTNFKLYLSLLNKANTQEKIDEYMTVLGRESTRLENLIEDLLALSRLDQQQVDFNFTPVDLNTLVNEYVIDRTKMAHAHNLTLDLQTAEQLPPIPMDQGMIGLVISILLTNAIHYTPAGGKISLHTTQKNSLLCLGITDNGPGISPEEQENIFTRFYRGSAGQNSGKAGTGLGLAIASEIIQQHNGQITVESDGIPGHGTTFSVWLPTTRG